MAERKTKEAGVSPVKAQALLIRKRLKTHIRNLTDTLTALVQHEIEKSGAKRKRREEDKNAMSTPQRDNKKPRHAVDDAGGDSSVRLDETMRPTKALSPTGSSCTEVPEDPKLVTVCPETGEKFYRSEPDLPDEWFENPPVMAPPDAPYETHIDQYLAERGLQPYDTNNNEQTV